jgi:hypothetical protein
MVKLTINEKSYKYPNGYKDVTLKEFKQIQDFLYSERNKGRLERVIKGKVTKKNEEDTLNFFVEFINYVTNIPTKDLKQVRRFTKDEELGIEDLFYSLSFLFSVPQIETPKPAERIGNYYFIDKIDLSQAILKDLNFIDYTEANAVINVFNELKEGRYEYLNNLLAIMYRPKVKKHFWSKAVIEPYNYDTMIDRCKEFENLTMDKVFNCMFFFMQLKTNSLKNIQHYLKEELGKAQLD